MLQIDDVITRLVEQRGPPDWLLVDDAIQAIRDYP